MKAFQARLAKAVEKGNLRHSDLAKWFGRRQSTIFSWARGVGPGGPPQDREAVYATMTQIEMAIDQRLLPLEVMPPQRRHRALLAIKGKMRTAVKRATPENRNSR